ncbi:hypothetical protein IEQ34_006537 [Dendrobium chrysotoxum]|uniref:Uncharacterized protein n=1 Tax=Dendrobium chrysotoxum TaxID=161865 RepID=A0AAV7H3T9_DENCH|nr:hypothetical protein IEQ34_006537 [Dendrobium chrysotoxum]
MEDKSWNTSCSSNIICPRQEHTRDNAVGFEISKHRVKRVTKRGNGFEEINAQVNRKGKGVVLAPIGEAEFGVGEGDDVEMDRVIYGGADDGGVDRGSKDGDAGTTRCKDLSHVDQGEQVALRHEREEKHVEIISFGAHG